MLTHLSRSVDALAERILISLAHEAICDGTSAAMQPSNPKLEELHHTATIAVQAASTRRVQLPECVHFLCEFSEVWCQLAKLQEHKVRIARVGSTDQQIPELQETIEVGVDKAVSRLMPMFDGPTQFWSLLFLAVEMLCAICSPAFDRDEVRAHDTDPCAPLTAMSCYVVLRCTAQTVVVMRRLEEYVDMCSDEGAAAHLVPLRGETLRRIRSLLASTLAACLLSYTT